MPTNGSDDKETETQTETRTRFSVWRLLTDRRARTAFAIVGFFIANAMVWWQTIKAVTVTAEQTKVLQTIETIRLVREERDRFSRLLPLPRLQALRIAIENCEPLYVSNKGSFTHQEINDYLTFFEDLGFYVSQGAVPLETADQFFGAFLVEALSIPELRAYIVELRRLAHQPRAFEMAEKLYEQLVKSSDHRTLSEQVNLVCSKSR